MKWLPKMTPRQILIELHDLAGTGRGNRSDVLIRFEGQAIYVRLPGFEFFLPVFLIYASGGPSA
jgi:hypothetical protein